MAELARRVADLEERVAARRSEAGRAARRLSPAKSTRSAMMRSPRRSTPRCPPRGTLSLTGLEAYRRHPYRRAARARRRCCGARERRGCSITAGRRRPGRPGRALADQPLLHPRSAAGAQLSAASRRRRVCGRWSSTGACPASTSAISTLDRLHRRAAGEARFRRREPDAPDGRSACSAIAWAGCSRLALALRRPAEIGCLALLATPWDFHAERAGAGATAWPTPPNALCFLPARRAVPVEVIQMPVPDARPVLAERKFIRFAGLDPSRRGGAQLSSRSKTGSMTACRLARKVARECARSWYARQPAGPRLVAGRRASSSIRGLLRRPALVVVPSRDRIVPPSSAEPLAAELPRRRPCCARRSGHVGMMSAARAPANAVDRRIAEWLRRRLAGA